MIKLKKEKEEVKIKRKNKGLAGNTGRQLVVLQQPVFNQCLFPWLSAMVRYRSLYDFCG
ncbi:hypothetical protein [Taibaiella helva]|uniref:hypothetical protein n=1 Tax=Taibaiella helva TaxID=2301235 RepID=UPI0013009872|nr:hypothetical protein [Taibaiella helva]